MKKLYIKRNYLMKLRDKKFNELDRIRNELRELSRFIYNKEEEIKNNEKQ